MPSDRLPPLTAETSREYLADWPDDEVRRRVLRLVEAEAAEQIRTHVYRPVDVRAWVRVASYVESTLNDYQ